MLGADGFSIRSPTGTPSCESTLFPVSNLGQDYINYSAGYRISGKKMAGYPANSVSGATLIFSMLQFCLPSLNKLSNLCIENTETIKFFNDKKYYIIDPNLNSNINNVPDNAGQVGVYCRQHVEQDKVLGCHGFILRDRLSLQ